MTINEIDTEVNRLTALAQAGEAIAIGEVKAIEASIRATTEATRLAFNEQIHWLAGIAG